MSDVISHLSVRQIKQKSLIVFVLTISVSLILVFFGMLLSRQIDNLETQLLLYSEQSSQSIDALNQIKANFGYGGFIHNFKNYILRRDKSLISKIDRNLVDTRSAILLYKKVAVTEAELKALEVINSIVSEYQSSFSKAQQMVSENQSQSSIDNAIKVNDEPALAALHELSQLSLQRHQQQKNLTHEKMSETQRYIIVGFLLLPVIFLIAWLFHRFLRQMIVTTEQLDSTSQYMNDLFTSIPDSILVVNQQGLIEDLNQAAVELTGFSKQELFGQNIHKLIPLQSRDTHTDLIQQSFQNLTNVEVRHGENLKLLTSQKAEVPVEIGINFSFFNDKYHAIVAMRDVSEQVSTRKILHDNEQMLNIAQSIAHIGSWDWNLKTNDILWSQEMENIFGFESQEFGVHYDTFVLHLHADDREEVVNSLNAAVVMNMPLDLIHRIVRADGEERIVHLRGEVYYEEEDEFQHLVGTLHDITLMRKAESELRLADNVFNHTEEGILISDSSNQILRVNPAFSKITGYSSEEAIGRMPEDLFKSNEHDEAFYQELWQTLLEKGAWSGEIWNRAKDNRHYPTWQNISVIRDAEDNIIQYMSIFSDITDKKIAEEHIHNLAQFDQLTGLPNRNLFNDRLEQALIRSQRSQQPVGLMFIDLDRFKYVNDSLGHQAGDELLKQVAGRLSECVRKQDTVARLGGDEFTIILEQINKAESCAMVAAKILKKLAEKVDLGQQHVTIGGSIGISIFPDDAEEAEGLIKNADMAMYQAKQLGKNQYRFYTDELSNQAETRFFIENRLNNAIENDEFELYYQPQINIQGHKLIGAEALIRWQDPQRGLISPDDFLPMAEESGLINKIGEWVIMTACTQAKQWQSEGFMPFKISVNVSGQQIIKTNIADFVRQSLEETQLEPRYLELELVENLVMQQPEKVINTIKELRAIGVSIAIDDFGTGYSSLSYLKKLAIDKLKIDRSFVIDIPTDKDDRAIVATIISMAKNLGLSVIAEGVENREHIKFLYEHDCLEMQGYYYSKPLSTEDFTKLLKNGGDFGPDSEKMRNT
jgi:diguanylate cyclase (GGDEF)-like protein/PAS domain S-box-containing protein